MTTDLTEQRQKELGVQLHDYTDHNTFLRGLYYYKILNFPDFYITQADDNKDLVANNMWKVFYKKDNVYSYSYISDKLLKGEAIIGGLQFAVNRIKERLKNDTDNKRK